MTRYSRVLKGGKRTPPVDTIQLRAWYRTSEVSTGCFGFINLLWECDMSYSERLQALSSSTVREYYDRLGMKLDFLSLFGMPAVNELITHSRFEKAQNIFELGGGTGKLARRLFEKHLPPKARYIGCDISPVMIDLAQDRLKGYAENSQMILAGSTVRFPLLDKEADRIISVFVLDLLSDEDVSLFFKEAYRSLKPDGKVCLACLHQGTNISSRMVSRLWTALFERRPDIVGGCRPIDLNSFVDRHHWHVAHRKVMTPFLIPVEVWVLEKRDTYELERQQISVQ